MTKPRNAMAAWTRRAAMLATAGALAVLPRHPRAQTSLDRPPPEKPAVQLGVGGKPLLYYLPLTLAERLGHFAEQGLEVTVNDFAGGAKSLQALLGGSVDVVTGAYDHCIQMQAKNQPITATCVLGRFPGIVLAVLDRSKWQGPQSLKGMKVGVTAPGSSTNFFVNFIMTKAGLKPDEASFIGVGGGPSAVAAVRRGEIDAIANLDPVISQLQNDGAITVVADTRTEEGTREVYGGGYPAAVLYTKPEFVERYPNTAQALTTALVQTLLWLKDAEDEEIADLVPTEYLLGDRDTYLSALKRSRPMYSLDGRLDMAAAANAEKVLAAFDPSVQGAKIDLARTWDGKLVDAAHRALEG